MNPRKPPLPQPSSKIPKPVSLSQSFNIQTTKISTVSNTTPHNSNWNTNRNNLCLSSTPKSTVGSAHQKVKLKEKS